MQKYLQASGGYHHWHSEIYPQNASCESLHRAAVPVLSERRGRRWRDRVLLPEAQDRGAPGPPDHRPCFGFTHSHKGHVARSSDKYIATSWILFQRAEALYGQPRPG
ncbi:hypothetical protein LP419_02070 [Massilia sp. H-1]|nr:hypothetical protein LP419_02070 [Massilia sp. H-1]